MSKIHKLILELIGIHISYDGKIYARTSLAHSILNKCVLAGTMIKDEHNSNFYLRIKK